MQKNNYNILTDEEMVKMAQEGSVTAEEYLIKKYKDLVKKKSSTYFIIGGDREDVVQEGMIGIFKAIRGFDENKEASFKTFAEVCINRQIIDAIRNANLQKHQILNESLSLSSDNDPEGEQKTLEERLPSNNGDDPETLMLMKEIGQYLKEESHEIFSALEQKVWDKMLQGKQYQEIALELEKSPKSIDNAMQRIKKKIYSYLGY
ncbi:MAG: RNA polymerase sporulation sigma factor SigH [Firmicutes bacterium]|nr:RNA polymerase sporulation sigma factor SigH [Bacillota bacterium]